MNYFVKVRRPTSWQPNYVTDRVRSIDFKALKQSGIRCVAFDVDCTITVNGSEDIDEMSATELKKLIDAAGIQKRFLASNSARSLSAIAKKLGGFEIHRPGLGKGKPSKHFYENLAKKADCEPDEIVMIGDRGLQDIWGARRSGMKAILVAIDPSHATFRDRIILRHIWQPILVRRRAKLNK